MNPQNEASRRAIRKTPRPFNITRHLQIDGRVIQIVPVSTEMDGLNVTTTYAQKELKPRESKKENYHTQKSKRILEALKSGEVVSGAELSRIGSGKPDGWCASLSKEISRCRALGHNIVKVVDKWVNGQRNTAYQLNPPSLE